MAPTPRQRPALGLAIGQGSKPARNGGEPGLRSNAAVADASAHGRNGMLRPQPYPAGIFSICAVG